MFKRKQVFQDSDGESLFLWGARQSGKTSLLKKIYQILLLLFSASLLTFSCSDAIVEPKSSEKEIVTFFVDDVEAIIDHSAKTIVLVLPPTSNLTSVKPLLSVSDKASVNPTSGTEKNFTNPVKYTVTAEDGTQQQYTVILTVSKPADKDILGFYISGELSNIWGTINGETNIIHMEVPADMDITKLKPVVVISPTATVSPASGVEQDFSKPVLYIVTAQDGSMREFMVIVEKKRVDKANPRLVITIRMNEYNDRPYRYLEYDNKDRLVHYTETAASRPGQEANMDVVKVIYGVNGQIVKLIKLEDAETARENSRTLNITYPDSKKIHVTEQLTATLSKLDVIILNDAGKVSRFVKDGETEVFEYDVAGNLIRLTGIDGIYKTITYDNKNGIFKDGNTPQWLWLYTIKRLIGIGPNNSLSVNKFTPNGQLIESNDYEYKYNPISDYPNAYSYRKGNNTIWTAMFYSLIKNQY